MTTHRQLLEQARNTLEKARDIVNPGLSPEHAAWWAELARSIHDIDTYLSKPEPVALMSDAEDARSGVQSISAGFDDPPFNGCPEEWCEKPFARIVYFSDDGDPSVGMPARSGWILAADQSGTVVWDLAKGAS